MKIRSSIIIALVSLTIFVYSILSFINWAEAKKQKELTNSLDGYWFGKYEIDDCISPILVQFIGNRYIDYFSMQFDTMIFERNENEFHFWSDMPTTDYHLNIIRKEDSLFYYFPDSNKLLNKLQKAKENHYFFDKLADKDCKIELPEGKGTSHNLYDKLGLFDVFYVSSNGNDLLVNYNDTTQIVDDSFYNKLINAKNQLSENDAHRLSTIIFADKNVTVGDINFIKQQFRIVYSLDIAYALKSDVYDKIKYLKFRLPILTEGEVANYIKKGIDLHFAPPPPPSLPLDILDEHGVVLSYVNGAFYYNYESINFDEVLQKITDKIRLDSSAVVAYYVDNRAFYQEYITLLDNDLGIHDVLREGYKKQLLDSLNREKEIMDEFVIDDMAKDKYPRRLKELDSTEYFYLHKS